MNLTRLLARAFAPLALLLLLLAVAACSNPGRDALDRASVVIDEHPDSAYAILAAVDPATLRNEADSALYALRWTQALYKTYRDSLITSDSIIKIATRFYEDKAPSYTATEAYYYSGITHQLLGEHGLALYDFMQASSLLNSQLDTCLLQGLAYRGIGQSLEELLDYSGALKNCRMAYDVFTSIDSLTYADHTLVDIALCQYGLHAYAAAERTIDAALRTKSAGEDPIFVNECIRIKGWIAAFDKRYDEAISYLTQYLSNTRGSVNAETYNRLGEAYLSLGDLPSATACMNAAEGLDSLNHTMRLNIYRTQGRHADALVLIDRTIESQNSYISNLQTQNGTELMSRYSTEVIARNQKQAFESMRRRDHVIFLFVLLVIGSVPAFLWIWRRLKQARFENKRISAELQDVRAVVAAQKKRLCRQIRIASENNRTNDEIPSKSQNLPQIQSNHFQAHNVKIVMDYYLNIEQLLSDGQADAGLIGKLIRNNNYGEKVISYFRSPTFKEESVRSANSISLNLPERVCECSDRFKDRQLLVSLRLLGFPVKICSFIMEANTQTLYSQLSSLEKHLKRHHTELYKEYHLYFDT